MGRNDYDHLGLRMFYAIGLLLVAWRIAPGDHGSLFLLVVSVLLGSAAGFGLMLGLNILSRTRGPRPLRLIPPPWIAAWLAILTMAFLFGTPHLRVDRTWETCTYFGWEGVLEIDRDKSCARILIVPLASIR